MTSFAVLNDPKDHEACSPMGLDPKKPSYPEVHFGDKHLKILETMLGAPLDIGDEVKVTVEFKVTSISKGQHGNDACLCVLGMDGAEVSEGDDEETDEEPDEDAPKPKKPAPKQPSMAASEAY